MKLIVLAGEFSVLRYPQAANPPPGIFAGEFASVTRTADELSVVAESRLVPTPPPQNESGFKAIKVEGPLDFSLTGILARLTVPLAEAKISIFALSTFDTDYVLVRAKDLVRAQDVLCKAGFCF